MIRSSLCRSVGQLGIWLGSSGCAQLVGADFDHLHARQSSGAGNGPPSDAAGAPNPLSLLARLPAPRRAQTSAQFGYTLAVDATALVVTAPYQDVDTETGIKVAGGATYVYDLNHADAAPALLVAPNVDAQDGVIPPSATANGFAQVGPAGSLRVALNDELIVIGVPAEDSALPGVESDNSAPEAGAVYVYDRTSLGAPPQYMKAPAPQRNALFGEYISLSGSRLAIGAPGENGAAASSGAVYVYERRNGRFDDVPARIAPETGQDGDSFGMSVAIEGDLVVVGATGESDPDSPASKGNGAVHIYRFVGGQWAHEQSVKPPIAKSLGVFGFGVAISHERIAVGNPGGFTCPGDDPTAQGPFRGTAFVLGNTRGAWSIDECLSPGAGLDNLFGWSVAMLGDQLIVGSPWDPSGLADNPRDNSQPYAGSAHLYERNAAGGWPETMYIKAPDIQANDVFGFPVAIAPGLVAVGAPQEAGGPHGVDQSHYSGAAYLFSLNVGR
jgi:hypothetical protein